MLVRFPLLHLILVTMFSSTAFAATPVEIDAAVARVSSATYRVKLAGACGWSKDEKQLRTAENVAKIVALKKDGLDKSLSTDEFVAVQLRVMDRDLIASMNTRAAEEAKSGGCDTQARKYWDMVSYLVALIPTQEP